MKHRLLMVDDDAILLQFIKDFLESNGYLVDTARSGKEAVSKVGTETKPYSLVILDYQMQGHNGAETAEQLMKINPGLFILVYSGDPSRDAIIQSTRNGARGFVDKAEGKEVFLQEVRKMCERFEKEALTVEDLMGKSDSQELIGRLEMVGRSQALSDIAGQVIKLRDKRGPVLILGESGTGKELVAKALHGNRKGPFKAVNCADYLMSKGTARSELFGYVKGAFTGAERDKPGVFEEALDGTVFLDEIYSLPPEAQVGLLRALQEKVITRIGSTREVKIRCRIVAAAKPDLAQDIAKDNFKADLYYRISQNIIEIPALRDRRDDISPLVSHFCKRWSEENSEGKTFLASTIPILERYSWPGNARELENVVYSVLNTSSKSLIGPEDLGERFKSLVNSNQTGGQNPLRSMMDSIEKKYILEVAGTCRTLKETAEKLGLSSQALLRLCSKHKLNSREIVGSKLSGHKGSAKREA